MKFTWHQMGILTALDLAAAVITLAVLGLAGFPLGYIMLGAVFVLWCLARTFLSHSARDDARRAQSTADERR